MNDQRSLTDQLITLEAIGNKMGLYDACDLIKTILAGNVNLNGWLGNTQTREGECELAFGYNKVILPTPYHTDKYEVDTGGIIKTEQDNGSFTVYNEATTPIKMKWKTYFPPRVA
jgi:hypothetical protein